MSKVNRYNLIVVFILALLPLVSHYFTGKQNPADGIGFDFLLYKPFDFAYVLFAVIVISVVNFRFSSDNLKNAFRALVWSLGFFVVSFLLLGELHLKLGGQL